MNRTIFPSNEDNLHEVYEEELKQMKEKEFIIECLKKLEIEDFPNELSSESKKNIEEAIKILRIHDHINIGNGLNLFGLKDLSSVNLSIAEQKLIRDRVEEMIRKESSKYVNLKPLEDKIQKEYENFFELQRQYREKVENLEKLKKEELELSMKVAEILIGDDQKLQVKGIEQSLRLLELRLKSGINALEKNELENTKYTREAFKIFSDRLDELIKLKSEK